MLTLAERIKKRSKLANVPIKSLEEYKSATSARRLNTISPSLGTSDSELIKQIYDYEYSLHKYHYESVAWSREACVWRIKDKEFLIKVYQQEKSVRVKRRIIRQNPVIKFPDLYKWILTNETNSDILKYAEGKVKRTPTPLRLMVGL